MEHESHVVATTKDIAYCLFIITLVCIKKTIGISPGSVIDEQRVIRRSCFLGSRQLQDISCRGLKHKGVPVAAAIATGFAAIVINLEGFDTRRNRRGKLAALTHVDIETALVGQVIRIGRGDRHRSQRHLERRILFIIPAAGNRYAVTICSDRLYLFYQVATIIGIGEIDEGISRSRLWRIRSY